MKFTRVSLSESAIESYSTQEFLFLDRTILSGGNLSCFKKLVTSALRLKVFEID